MSGIFINYRHTDSGYSGRLYDHLCQSFDANLIFRDVDTIRLGSNFAEAIDNAVGSCDALIVLIGQGWLSVSNGMGQRRIDDPRDYVRLEIATALRRNVRVFPVLIPGAMMPSENELPSVLRDLASRQALTLNESRFKADMDLLIKELKPLVENSTKKETTPCSERLGPAVEYQSKRRKITWFKEWIASKSFIKSRSIFFSISIVFLVLVATIIIVMSYTAKPIAVKRIHRIHNVNPEDIDTLKSNDKENSEQLVIVFIGTQPAGFDIFVDENRIGTTPWQTELLVGTKFRAILKRQGYKEEVIKLKIGELDNNYWFAPDKIQR